MKFLMTYAANPNNPPPTPEHLQKIGKYTVDAMKSGVVLMTGGLVRPSTGTRVRMSAGSFSITDAPLPEAKELIAGYWIWQVRSMDEAVEWARRCPDPMPGEEGELEIRPIFEAEDFGKEYTPELRAQEERLRAEIERKSKK